MVRSELAHAMRRPSTALPDPSSASAVSGKAEPTATVAVRGEITTDATEPPGSSESPLHARAATTNVASHRRFDCLNGIDYIKNAGIRPIARSYWPFAAH